MTDDFMANSDRIEELEAKLRLTHAQHADGDGGEAEDADGTRAAHVAEVEDKLRVSQEQLATVQEQLATVEEQLATVEEQLATVQEQMAAAQKEVSSLQAQNKRLQSSAPSAAPPMSPSNAAATERAWKEKLAAVENQSREKVATVENRLKEKVAAVENQLAKAQDDNRKLREELSGLRARCEASACELSAAKEESAAAGKQRELMESRSGEMEAKARLSDELEAQLQTTLAQLKDATGRVDEADAATEEVRGELMRARDALREQSKGGSLNLQTLVRGNGNTHAVLCCAVLCCAVLCCAMLCCAMLCYAMLCCVVLHPCVFLNLFACVFLLYFYAVCCDMLRYAVCCVICYGMLCGVLCGVL